MNWGGLCAYSCPTGSYSGVNDITSSISSGNVGFKNLTLPDQYRVGKRRVIGIGFEVYNVSAELYRGGSVVCYRQPVESFEDANTMLCNVGVTNTVSGFTAGKAVCFNTPPISSGNALLLPYSRQWDAKEGAYVVGAFNSNELAPHNSNPVIPIILDPYGSQNGTRTSSITWTSYPQQFTTSSTGTAPQYCAAPIDFVDIDQSGAYFTGLAPQSSLLINYNIYLERFPSNEDLDLVVLAKPAPERDDVALKFYSHASDQLPVGVPVKENGLGDWFKDVIGTASDYIAPVLSAVPHPGAQGIGMLIKGTNALVNKDRVPQMPPSNARMIPQQISYPTRSPAQYAKSHATKARNEMVRAKNLEVRAKNERIRARKELKKGKK